MKTALKARDPDDFPNQYILLKIAATLPVKSCECERSHDQHNEKAKQLQKMYHGRE